MDKKEAEIIRDFQITVISNMLAGVVKDNLADKCNDAVRVVYNLSERLDEIKRVVAEEKHQGNKYPLLDKIYNILTKEDEEE